LAKFPANPVTLVRSPMLTKFVSGRTVNAPSAEAKVRLNFRGVRRGKRAPIRNSFDVRRRRPAAAPTMFSHPFSATHEAAAQRFRRFRKSGGAEDWQPGIRIGAHVNRRDFCQFLRSRAILRPKCAVHATLRRGTCEMDSKTLQRFASHTAMLPAWMKVTDAIRERGNCAPRNIFQSRRAAWRERIENGFDQENIRASIQQAADLLGVRGHQFVISPPARRGAVDVGRIEEVRVVGPMAPATKQTRPACVPSLNPPRGARRSRLLCSARKQGTPSIISPAKWPCELNVSSDDVRGWHRLPRQLVRGT